MRLIDANVLLKVFKELISAYRQIEGKHNWGDHCRIPAFEFMDALKSAKTIDAVQVIRCKDCRWYKTNYSWDGKEHRICAIEAYEPARKADDFCNRAERKVE